MPQAQQAADTGPRLALDEYIGGLPISPIGYFRDRDAILNDEDDGGECPPDCASFDELYEVHSDSAAWEQRRAPFCCVGVPTFCGAASAWRPHNVSDASDEAPIYSLAHLVECTTSNMHERSIEVSMAYHCEECAHAVLEARCPLRLVSTAALQAQFAQCECRRAAARETW
jgi:hypothetical protein